MTSRKPAIVDWNDEYDNVGHIPNAMAYIDESIRNAKDFRDSWPGRVESNIRYGPKERQIYDKFHPQEGVSVKGLFIFVHGGYWFRFDKSYFSHLAKGPLSKGYVVVMPSYTLCPTARVHEITTEITASINHAADEFPMLPIVLCGHSAGGHLATRQICLHTHTVPVLKESVIKRLKEIISISGVHDLRPILRIVQNDTIHLKTAEAVAESPALQTPLEGVPVLCIVGADERPEFVRQNDLLANIWRGMGVATTSVHVPDKHHFDIIDDLLNSDGIICTTL